MISIYELKPKFQNLLRPIIRFLNKAHITANQITLSAFFLSAAVGLLVYLFAPVCRWTFLLLPVYLFIRMALNALDGMMARECNQKTRLGAIYNEMGDMLSDIVLYIPFFYVRGVNVWLILLFTVLTLLTETCGIMGVQINASRRYDGPMGKSDRAFWVGFLALLSVWSIPCPHITQYITGLLCFLLAFTCWNRLKNALKESK